MAVYTHITEEDAARHLLRFDLGTLASLTGIAEGVENTNYLLATERGKFILTLFEKRIRAEELPFCLSFMEFLRTEGIPSPRVIAAETGETISPLCGRPAVLTTFLEGRWPKQIETFHASDVGGLLARMHVAGEKFTLKRENTLSLPTWRTLVSRCEEADQLQTGLSKMLREELEYLGENWPSQLPSGAVHADLFPDNVFFGGEGVSGVIDFYFSCTDFFAYDLMLTLNAWCFEPAGLNVKKSTALLEAYEKIRPLVKEEQDALPLFGRAAALRIVATRLYDWLHPVADAEVRPKDPLEYVRILDFYRMGS